MLFFRLDSHSWPLLIEHLLHNWFRALVCIWPHSYRTAAGRTELLLIVVQFVHSDIIFIFGTLVTLFLLVNSLRTDLLCAWFCGQILFVLGIYSAVLSFVLLLFVLWRKKGFNYPSLRLGERSSAVSYCGGHHVWYSARYSARPSLSFLWFRQPEDGRGWRKVRRFDWTLHHIPFIA